jgi:hypothetical protein
VTSPRARSSNENQRTISAAQPTPGNSSTRYLCAVEHLTVFLYPTGGDVHRGGDMNIASASGKPAGAGRIRRVCQRARDVVRAGYEETPAIERGLLSISGAASGAMYASPLVTLVNKHRHGQPTIRSLGRGACRDMRLRRRVTGSNS